MPSGARTSPREGATRPVDAPDDEDCHKHEQQLWHSEWTGTWTPPRMTDTVRAAGQRTPTLNTGTKVPLTDRMVGGARCFPERHREISLLLAATPSREEGQRIFSSFVCRRCASAAALRDRTQRRRLPVLVGRLFRSRLAAASPAGTLPAGQVRTPGPLQGFEGLLIGLLVISRVVECLERRQSTLLDQDIRKKSPPSDTRDAQA